MEKMYTEDKEEIEIDLRELLFELKKRLWLKKIAEKSDLLKNPNPQRGGSKGTKRLT